MGKRELILVLFIRLFYLRLFGLSVSSSSWCLGRAAVCDYGTPWTFHLPFFFFFFYLYHSLNILSERQNNDVFLSVPRE